MIVLLDGHSLTPEKRFEEEKRGVSLSERGSTMTLTISDKAPVVAVDDWMLVESGPGSGIVWRVRTIDVSVEKRTRTVTLEHTIMALKDRVMFGEVKSSDISGSSANPTARQAAEYILNKQSDWVLGDCSFSVSNPYSFNGDDLFSALETVSGSLEDCIWEYDFSVYPFVIHLHKMNSTICSEMRADRNIWTLKKTIDRSRMYTRHYPIGKNNLHITGNYISKNENLYGIVSKVETDQSKGTEAELRAWAQERLNRHCEPIVTVTISGLDLSEATGETLDSFIIGKMCRVPLPEFSTSITERIKSLNYPDGKNSPEEVTITLANDVQDVQTILKEQAASSGRGGRTGAKNAEEDHAWIVDTEDHVSLIAEAVAGKDGDEPNWSRVAELTVDGNGIDARVTHAEGEIVDAWSEINQTESKISLAVTNAVSEMRSELEITASGIRAEVNAAGSTIYSYVNQTATNIRTVIENTASGLKNYTDQTASGIHSLLVNTTNQVWIQDSDPTSASGGSHTVKVGDVWIESTHQGTWDGAEGFDWDHDEQYDWNQIQGAKVWGWQNGKWELVSDQQQVVSYRDVVDTADLYIRRYVAGIVNDEGLIEVYLAQLEMTAQELRSDISAAGSTIYSSIQQTATNIMLQVGQRPRTVVSKTQPTTIDGRSPRDDDVWIESEGAHIWEDLESADWSDEEAIEWNKLRTDTIHVWKDGKWQTAIEGTVLLEEADVEVDRQQAKMYAKKLDVVDGQLQQYYAELKVESNRIRSMVSEVYNDVGSSITQTAREIRLEVHADKSQLWSAITQTASSIRSEVANEISSVRSSIVQTASSITTSVSAANSAIYTKIAQTASSIRSDVVATESRMSSSITQTAGTIRSEVSAADSAIYSTITQTASSIRSEVSAADSAIYSKITQTASSIRSEVTATESRMSSSITQTATAIRSEVSAADSAVYTKITQTATAIRSEVSNKESNLNSTISQTAATIRSEVSAANSSIYSTITQTASSIRVEVNNSISSVQSSINVQADRISLVVSGTGSNAKIRPAQIVTAINNQTGTSQVLISANKVVLDGYVKATDLTADKIKSLVGDVNQLKIINANVTGNLTIKNGSGQDQNVNGGIWDLNLSLDGNTYTLKRKRFSDQNWVDVGTFSRATSLSGTWSSNQLTVAASPQGVNYVISFGARFREVGGVYSIEATSTKSGTTSAISGTSTTIKLGRSSNVIQIQNSGGTQIGNTPTYSLTSHSNCVNSLTQAKVNGNKIHGKLYYKDGSTYKEVVSSEKYWYYRDNDMNPTTYYS